MSNYNEDSGMKDNIVKLHVDGASRVVNTIEDQKTSKGLSLVCPFPALEVDIPIRFTGADGQECRGKIHRIGVEDDPVTGLPKLRLSVRNEQNEEVPAWMTPSEDLFAEPDGMEKAVEQILANAEVPSAFESSLNPQDSLGNDDGADDDVDEGIDVEIPVEVNAADCDANDDEEDADERDTVIAFTKTSDAVLADAQTGEHTLMDGLFDDLPMTNTAELLSLDEFDSVGEEDAQNRDPEWASYMDMPIPNDMIERSQTRRRRRAIAVAAWMMVLGIAAGGLYVLNTAGILNMAQVQKYVSVEDSASETPAQSDALDRLSVPVKESSVVNEQATESAAQPTVMNTGMSDAPRQVAETNDAAHETLADAENMAAENMVNMVDEEIVDEAAGEVVADAEPAAEEAMAGAVEDLKNTEIILPTRWPAEFATAYRLQNPNGVVVDVPGGLVKREGWLNLREDNTIIRSIKAVQRENGARFIVYVKGNLPNFKTSPKSGGIRLSLYYDSEERASSETQQVAMLDE
ncbi:MAG: AMIN domain-containing protein [Deltaproteobacteria bacterium]|nr:AMIN domain-containing protein [Deltaproteobacteria bacterium]